MNKRPKPRDLSNKTPTQIRAMGYRVISRAYCMVARIDRPDWREHCATKGYPVNESWYRRCVTNDKTTIKPSQIKAVGPSDNDKIGFIHLGEPTPATDQETKAP